MSRPDPVLHLSSPLLSPRLLRLQACRSHLGSIMERRREMTTPPPPHLDKKDAASWDKRRKNNNEAAKRSREKRRFKDLLLEGQLVVLSEENCALRCSTCWRSAPLPAQRRLPPPRLTQSGVPPGGPLGPHQDQLTRCNEATGSSHAPV